MEICFSTGKKKKSEETSIVVCFLITPRTFPCAVRVGERPWGSDLDEQNALREHMV